MKQILSILKAIGIITGFAVVIWQVAVFVNNNRHHNEQIQSQVSRVIQADSLQCIKIDSILVNQTRLNSNVNDLTQSQRALRQSYINYLSNDDALTKEEFVEYMQDLGLDLKKNSQNKDIETASRQ